jgi:hypothetical protein
MPNRVPTWITLSIQLKDASGTLWFSNKLKETQTAIITTAPQTPGQATSRSAKLTAGMARRSIALFNTRNGFRPPHDLLVYPSQKTSDNGLSKNVHF